MHYRIITTFTGPFALIRNTDDSLNTSWVTQEVQERLDHGRRDPKLLGDLVSRLRDFFAGKVVDFSDIDLPQGSPFHRKCWDVCRSIPRGEMISYLELAHRSGSPNGSRAAGQSMRRNPLPVIIPCHRVVGSDGKLHGFGGSCDVHGDALQVKSALLRMEGAIEGSNDLHIAGRSRSRLALAV